VYKHYPGEVENVYIIS